MNKVIFSVLLGIAFLSAPVFAADEAATATVQPVEVGNKVCPVSGEEIDSSSGMKAATVEHNGKIYNLCCAMCEGEFKKNPEKYSKIAEDEVAAQKGSGS
jgi:YHS domain-containing protein